MNTDFGSIFSTLLAGANAKLEPQEGCKVEDGLVVKVGFGKVWKQSLTELSGGQRSLVALSLVLSLLRFKPAPIYILDEVDAALDLSHTQERFGPRPVGVRLKLESVCICFVLAEHRRHDPHAFQAVAVSCCLPQGGHVQQRQRALPHEVRGWRVYGHPHGLCLPPLSPNSPPTSRLTRALSECRCRRWRQPGRRRSRASSRLQRAGRLSQP